MSTLLTSKDPSSDLDVMAYWWVSSVPPQVIDVERSLMEMYIGVVVSSFSNFAFF